MMVMSMLQDDIQEEDDDGENESMFTEKNTNKW